MPVSIVGPCASVLDKVMQQVGNPAAICTDAEMSVFLDALLETSLATYDPQYESFAGPIAPSLKWRYSSAYQKAVRRNDLSIKAVAAALNACDPAYIWRRVPTIALEDVALGDPWVVAVVLHACRFARVRAKHGQDRLAGYLGTLMGSAVKDRLSCDSFCFPYFHPKLAKVRAAVDRMDVSERAELYRSDDTPFPWRVAAGITLAGPRYGGETFKGIGGSPERFADAASELAPYPIRWISRQYAKVGRDGMFVTLPLVWRQLNSEMEVHVAYGQMPERHLIKGVLAATFDGHTREGRQAIAQFGANCPPIAQIAAGLPNRQKALELAVFTVDSSLLDRRLVSPWAEALYQANLQGEVMAASLPLARFDKLAGAVMENLNKLNSFRSFAAK